MNDVPFMPTFNEKDGKKQRIEVSPTSHRKGITVLLAIAMLLLLSGLAIGILYGKDGASGTGPYRNLLATALALAAISPLVIAGLLLLDSLVSNKRKYAFQNLEVPREFTIHAFGSRQKIKVCGAKLEIFDRNNDAIYTTRQVQEAHFTKSRILGAYPQVIILDRMNQPLEAISLRLSDYHLLRKYFMSWDVSVNDTYQRW